MAFLDVLSGSKLLHDFNKIDFNIASIGFELNV